MRLPEEQIKQAILHPDLFVRTLALEYFSRSFSGDATVMPLVIEAVEKFGREPSIHLVGDSEKLPQTESTIEWCMQELRKDSGEQDEILENYRFVLSKVLATADLSLMHARESQILELACFIPELGPGLSERIQLAIEETGSLWNKLLEFCERENEKQYLSEMDLPHANRLVESLARHGVEVADRVLTMLNEKVDNSVSTPRTLMQGFVVRLAGELRLRAAVPALVETLKEDDDWFNQECQRALIRIGGNDVVEALSNEFPTAEWHFRLYGSGVLEQLHTDRTVATCIELFEREKDETIKSLLGQAALSQFASEAVEPMRQFILANKLGPEILDLRETLVSVSAVLGVEFPEFADWKKEDEESRALRRKLLAEKYGNFNVAVDDWDDGSTDGDFDSEVNTLAEATHAPTTIFRQDARVGRNDACPCGSGKKYKKCCMNRSDGDPLLN